MRIHTTTAALAAAAILALTGCSTSSDSSKPAEANELTLQEVADTLDKAHTISLGDQNPGPVEEDDGNPNAVVARIDTDRVLIYELKTPKSAKHWADTMSEGSSEREYHAAGRFMLSWRTDEVPSSEDYINTLNKRLDKLVAEHNK
ncbi:hypothetical protein ACGRHY_14535 [Streptomyces sp. HK10]|uniref:hypothetical protein n=1 Tax=Streptomyces sp. HK10 TaxID=3373255 RepID=UPI0037492A38